MKPLLLLAATPLLLLLGCGTAHRSCAEAGGTCVPEAPDSCQVGISASSDQFSCGQPDAQRVFCCLPPDAGFD